MKRIIVTGATGSIGSATVKSALAKGYDVTCIVHKGTTRIDNIPKSENVHIVECDVADYVNLNLEGKYDILIHLAWEKTYGALRDDVDIQLANIKYTLDACRLAKRCGCSAFVGAGSQAEFGVQTVTLSATLPVKPESGYGIAKYAAGELSLMLCNQLGIKGNWVRIVSVYGPYDGEKTLIKYVISEFKARRKPSLTKCEQIWDYLYSDDAGEAFVAVGERGVAGKTYVLGSGKGVQLSEYIKQVRDEVNPSCEIGFGEIDYFPHQPMHLVADITDLKEDTGWEPHVAFEEGIKMMENE